MPQFSDALQALANGKAVLTGIKLALLSAIRGSNIRLAASAPGRQLYLSLSRGLL